MDRKAFIKTTAAGALAWKFAPKRFAGIDDLPRASPESQGISSAGLRKFLDAANESHLSFHSFMLLRHGKVVAEGWWKPYAPQFKHSLFSLSKSFTGTAIGLLVGEGKLDIETPILSFFPGVTPHEGLAHMTIRHLLTMTTGQQGELFPKLIAAHKPWTQVFLEEPLVSEPGTQFAYNTASTYMLGVIVTKVTGELLEKYLTPRLFEPLGIRDHDWQISPDGYNTAGYGLRLRTEDIAKFGQLYLQNGKWKDRQVIAESWVREATKAQVKSASPNGPDWNYGYGYQFWRSSHGAFRGDGYYGQYCLVMPEQDAVVVITGEIGPMQQELDLVWANILPAMQAGALPENPAEFSALRQELQSLVLAIPKSSTHSLRPGGKYALAPNAFSLPSVTFVFSAEGCTLNFPAFSLRFGWENWILNEGSRPYPFPLGNSFPMTSALAGTATWLNADTLQLNLQRTEAMNGDRITCTFSNESVTMEFLNSIAEKSQGQDAPESRPPLIGSLIAA